MGHGIRDSSLLEPGEVKVAGCNFRSDGEGRLAKTHTKLKVRASEVCLVVGYRNCYRGRPLFSPSVSTVK